MSNRHKHFYEFEGFRLDPSERQLRSEGKILPLTPKAFDVLLLLVENGGHALRKHEFLEKIWADSYVEEKNLADNISLLRKILGDDVKAPSFIETVPRLGYRFVADVREVREEGADLLLAERSREHVVIEEEFEPTPALTAGAEPALTLPATARKTKLRFAVVIVAFVVVAFSVAAYYLARSGELRPVQPQQFKSLAVLPLKPLGVTAAGGDDSYLGPGLADALITKLSNLRQIAVRPTSAVRKYAGPQSDLVAVAREQQVDAVLDGSFQRVGDRVRVTVQLVRGSDGASLWAQTFDERLTDMFSVQDAISSRVVEALKIKLSNEEERRFARKQTDNPEAYQLYLRGRYLWNKFTPEDHRKAADYFNQAIAKDPAYALAYAGLADAYGASATNNWLRPREAYPRAKAAAQKALELDDTLPDAHASLGAILMFYDLDWPAAEREFLRAIELNTDCATAHEVYSYLHVALGRLDEAAAQARRGLEADPLSGSLSDDLAGALYQARRYDDAIRQYQRTLEIDPRRPGARLGLGTAYVQSGRHGEAVAELEKAVSLSGRTSANLAQLGYAYAAAGRRNEALKILEELSGPDYSAPYDLAVLYAGLGQREQALAQLMKAYDERSGWIIFLKVEPQFDSLRDDPRYAELLRRMGLPQ
jgi:TolB-like protein/DNA-binding winged helix-turn-helix (wHTH) protein/Flp pilus assembly protein TadD